MAVKDAGTRFPFISLEKAIGRAQQVFEADPQGRPMPVPLVYELWSYSPKSSGGHQTVAALKAYGLLDDTGTLADRRMFLSDLAKRYFLDEREEERSKVLTEFALAPKLIAALWGDWGESPPADNVARSHLKLERKLNDQSARSLLGIYKNNLAYANLKGSGNVSATVEAGDELSHPRQEDAAASPTPAPTPTPTPPIGEQKRAKVMETERVLTQGILSKRANFRVLVEGPVSDKEIDRLIAKLQLDKEILADSDDDEAIQ